MVHFINSNLFRSQVEEYGKGATRFRIATGNLKTIVLPVPPVDEQIRIRNKIDELMALCDQLESQTEASIEAHQTLVKSLLETLTNAKDADELNESWLRISEHFDVLFTTEDSIDQLNKPSRQTRSNGQTGKTRPQRRTRIKTARTHRRRKRTANQR